MADLPEVNEWPEGIYQLETSDPVLGGPEGIDNLQAKQLANRTKWLKDQLAKIVDGVIAIGKAAQLATPRALRFKGAATGSGDFDGSADTEITLTLSNSGVAAGTYPKVTVNGKGLVTGGAALVAGDLPEGITAPQFDNDRSLATTEFVQRALGSYSGVVGYETTGAIALSAEDIGKHIVVSAASSLSLPAASSVAPGSTIHILASGLADLTVSRIGTDTISRNDSQTVSSLLVKSRTSIMLRQGLGGTAWLVCGGDASLQFSSSFSGQPSINGHQRSPSGVIEQWGTVTLGTIGAYFPQVIGGVTWYTHFFVVTLPRAYTAEHFQVVVSGAGRATSYQDSEILAVIKSSKVTTGPGESLTSFTVSVTTPATGWVPVIHYKSTGR